MSASATPPLPAANASAAPPEPSGTQRTPRVRDWLRVGIGLMCIVGGLIALFRLATSSTVEMSYDAFLAAAERPRRVRLVQCRADLDRGWVTEGSSGVWIPLARETQPVPPGPIRIVAHLDDKKLRGWLAAAENPSPPAAAMQALDAWAAGPFEGDVDSILISGEREVREELPEIDGNAVYMDCRTIEQRLLFALFLTAAGAGLVYWGHSWGVTRVVRGWFGKKPAA